MKRNHFLIIILAGAVGLSSFGCQSWSSGQANSGHSREQNQAVNPGTSESRSTVSNGERAIPAGLSDDLSTPTGAYKMAYAARKNRDVDRLKRVFSKDMLEFFTMVGESDKKTLEDVLKNIADEPQGRSDETQNEKISGSTATLDYRDKNGGWKQMDLVKEGDEWKLTIPTPAKKR